jgi:predicted DCC family thiol-disulfide oxidoreductase YuxK
VWTRVQLPGSKTSSAASARRPRPWLLYDADCGVCKFIVARVLELDRGRYRPLAIQDPRSAELLPGTTEEERLRSFHIVDPDGTVRSAGEGLAELIPGLSRFPRLAARAYWLVADNRTRLGKLLPDAARRQARRRIDAESRSRGSGP